jgi:hypothetical protein
MSAKLNWTVAVRPSAGEQLHKITKIIGLNGGGFSVLAPYHNERSGFLFKLPVGRKNLETVGIYKVAREECVNFTADDRAKLSYHVDGFAQFSSEKKGTLISGRDANGRPKGLGLMARPFSNPIWSGASVGVTVWGLEEFEQDKQGESELIFEPEDFYYRDLEFSHLNAFHLQIYVFPARVIPPIHVSNGRALLDVALEPLNGALVSVARFRVIQLTKEEVFLGLIVNRTEAAFPSKSGWTLNGPGDYTYDRAGHALMGIYPRFDVPSINLPSLNRNATPGPPL